MSEKLALSISEAAESLNVSKPTLYNLLRIDGFPSFKVGSRTLISADGLRAWVEQQSKKEETA